jgi:formylglycine-generating enzyme required for sulfatase activity
LPPTTTAPALAKPKLDAEAPEPKPKPKPEVPEDMALVPAGTFSMGADDEGEMDERPAHSTTVKAFLLDDETGIDP